MNYQYPKNHNHMRAEWKKITIPGVWELISPHTGSTLVLMGQIHGNEPVGFKVIRRLLTMKKELAESMRGGRLVLIRGNLAAAKIRKRCTQGGMDLNRVWFTPEEIRTQWLMRASYEWKRRRELLPYVRADKNTVSLDIHSSSSPTKPFLILPAINKKYERWIRLLGVPIASFGWNNLLTGGHTTLEWVHAQGGIGMGVECGKHDGLKTFENAWQVASNFLAGVFVCFPPPQPSASAIFKMKKTITYVEDFRWKKEKVVGPLHVQKGECFGTSAQGDMASPDEGYIFLPNARPEPDNPDIGYLGKNVITRSL